MQVIYTEYAETTLRDRNLEKKLIEDALRYPDEVVDGTKARKIAHKLVKGKLLRVIYEIEEKAYIVVTAYYADPQRYLKQ